MLNPSEDQFRDDSYYENYRVTEDDLRELTHGIDLCFDSGLFVDRVLDEIRFVTYDSEFLYICTKGEHLPTADHQVDELPSDSENGVRIFKVENSGITGRSKPDYKGARAWLLCDEIETTAVNAKKFPNENTLFHPEIQQPSEILDVVKMAPYGPYFEISMPKYNYLTDVVFHEAGHIEHRRLKNWQTGQEVVPPFPNNEKFEELVEFICKNARAPSLITDVMIRNITSGAVHEMYAVFIDIEASERYDPKHYWRQEASYYRYIDYLSVTDNTALELRNRHRGGEFLARAMHHGIPNFSDRKDFLRSVLF